MLDLLPGKTEMMKTEGKKHEQRKSLCVNQMRKCFKKKLNAIIIKNFADVNQHNNC